jgi:hypothetical protein
MSERLRRFTLPALIIAVLFAVALGAGYVTESNGTTSRETTAATVPQGVRGSIQALNANSLTLRTADGVQQFTLSPDAIVEVSRPTTASTIKVGEWLNVGAIPNGQTLFAIIGLTLIPDAMLQSR